MVDTPLRHEVFAPLVNQPFQIGDRALVCELVEVSSVQRATTFKGSFATFSLLFAAPPSSLSNDGEIQKVEHTTAGQFEMFLAPVGKPGGRKQLLQAVCSARTA